MDLRLRVARRRGARTAAAHTALPGLGTRVRSVPAFACRTALTPTAISKCKPLGARVWAVPAHTRGTHSLGHATQL